MEPTVIAELLSGPFGALSLSVGILVWMSRTLVPMCEKYLQKQNDSLAELVKALVRTVASHEKDRESFVQSLEKLSVRIEKVEESLNNLAKGASDR